MLVEKNSRELKAMAHGMDIESEYSSSKLNEEEIKMLVESIENELKQVPSSPANYTIYRILKPLRDVKPESYTPRMVSIGPFHRDSIDLKPMEAHKLWLLKCFLHRIDSKATLADYVREMSDLEKQARQCYSEVIPFTKDEFVRMMVFDGCFLLELILGWKDHDDNPIFNETWMPQIVRDLMLLENQLPFFVLESLYKLYMRDSGPADAIYDVTHAFLQDFLPRSPTTHKKSKPQRISKWVKSIFLTPSEMKEDQGNQLPDESPSRFHSNSELKIDWGESSEESSSFNGSNPHVPQGGPKHLLDYVRQLLVSQPPKEDDKKQSLQPQGTHCATELKKATVKFKKSKTTHFSDITFEEGVLRIPAINIDDLTESLLRNLIALEQSHHYDAKYVTAYAVFMDDLINSPEDVKLLQDEGIFESLINLEEVAALFDKLLKEVTQPNDLCFSHVYNELERYYKDTWHILLAKVQQHIGSLKTKYFKNPWSFISFVAAIALFGLTIAQTIASFKSTNPDPKGKHLRVTRTHGPFM